MTPDDFRNSVVPQVDAAWKQHCFCANPGFQKLLSFNFRDYEVGPIGLADAEILVDTIIRQHFTQLDAPASQQGEVTQSHVCPQCGSTCTEFYREFSIAMFQTTVTFDLNPVRADTGLYLFGFYGFNSNEFAEVHDFRLAATVAEFTDQLR